MKDDDEWLSCVLQACVDLGLATCVNGDLQFKVSQQQFISALSDIRGAAMKYYTAFLGEEDGVAS